MAATGLLGINPYYKGVAIDISSKPTQIAIQLEQRERAKAEALEKSFMDYEKSINPKGLSPQEGQEFTKKYNNIREYWIKNKEDITRPAKSKSGYGPQAEYLSLLKDAQTYIEEGKSATAERKALKDFYVKNINSGKRVSGNYAEVLDNAMKTVGSGYTPPDYSQIKTLDPFNPIAFGGKVNTLLKRTEGMPEKRFLETTINGKPIKSTTEFQYVTPTTIDKNQAKNIAFSEMQDESYVEFLNNIADQPDYLKSLNEIYRKNEGKDLPIVNNKVDLKELSYANVLSQVGELSKPGKVQKTEEEITRLAKIRQKPTEPKIEFSPEIIVDDFYEAGEPFKASISGKTIEGRKIQLPPEIADEYDRKVGNKKFSPNYFVMTNDKLNVYPIFVTDKTATGQDILSGDDGTKLDEKIPVKTSLIPTIGKAYGGIGYTRRNLPGMRPVSQGTPSVSGKSGVSWKKPK